MSRISKDKFDRDRDIQKEIKNTEAKKHKFIEEIKNGLGQEIKKNPSMFAKVDKPKKNIIQKILKTIKG